MSDARGLFQIFFTDLRHLCIVSTCSSASNFSGFWQGAIDFLLKHFLSYSVCKSESDGLRGDAMLRQDMYRTILAGMLWFWCTCSMLAQQSTPVPEVLLPREQQVYGWGQSAPAIRIEVRAVPSSSTVRHFATAVLFAEDGRLVDRVSLRDDGMEHDATANDGVFSHEYTVKRPGRFRLITRLERQDTAQGLRSEKWSRAVTFSVVQVPYVQLLSPKPDSRVSSRTRLSGVLLIGSEKQTYTPKRGEVRLRCWSEPAATMIAPDNPSGDFSIRVEFPRPGRYQLFVGAQTLRDGRWIESEPDGMAVNATTVWLGWLYLSLFLLLVAFALPGKKVPLYCHELRLITPEGEQPLEIKPKKLATASQKIPGTKTELVAQPGLQLLQVAGEQSEHIPATISQGDTLTLPGGYKVYYTSCKIDGSTRVPRYKISTRLKRNLVLASAVLLIIQLWTYWRFTQLM
jgi:hypothetical protein